MALESTDEETDEILLLCRNLRELREQQGLSQRDVAAEMGMAQPNYNRLENGKYTPRMSTIQSWARALGFRVEISLVRDDQARSDSLDKLFGLS